MSVIGEIRGTLDAMGLEQQACVFAFLCSYPLALGALLPAGARRAAGLVAATAAAGLVATTHPWVHGVLLATGLVSGLGLFILAVCALDRAPRWLRPAPMLAVAAADDPAAGAGAVARERRGRGLPFAGRAGTT